MGYKNAIKVNIFTGNKSEPNENTNQAFLLKIDPNYFVLKISTKTPHCCTMPWIQAFKTIAAPRQLFGLNPSADVENVDFSSIITVYTENILTLIETSIKLITYPTHAVYCTHATKRERVQIINRWTNVSSLFNDGTQLDDTHNF